MENNAANTTLFSLHGYLLVVFVVVYSIERYKLLNIIDAHSNTCMPHHDGDIKKIHAKRT